VPHPLTIPVKSSAMTDGYPLREGADRHAQ
jgi:hypothetical protein